MSAFSRNLVRITPERCPLCAGTGVRFPPDYAPSGYARLASVVEGPNHPWLGVLGGGMPPAHRRPLSGPQPSLAGPAWSGDRLYLLRGWRFPLPVAPSIHNRRSPGERRGLVRTKEGVTITKWDDGSQDVAACSSEGQCLPPGAFSDQNQGQSRRHAEEEATIVTSAHQLRAWLTNKWLPAVAARSAMVELPIQNAKNTQEHLRSVPGIAGWDHSAYLVTVRADRGCRMSSLNGFLFLLVADRPRAF